jgi:hypothetical protein
MDMAAEAAQKDLETLDPEAVKAIAKWWKKWYLQAGHKRLARIILGKLQPG